MRSASAQPPDDDASEKTSSLRPDSFEPPRTTSRPSNKPKSLLGKAWKQATGKEYQFGDISRAIDSKAKETVAKLAGKDEYEFGDLSRTVDAAAKNTVAQLAGKDEYEFGDLSRTVDAAAKDGVARLAGKDEYEFGDLSRTVDAAAKDGAARLAGKDEYEFGDVSRAVDQRVKAAVNQFTGQNEYQFGDLTKALDRKAKAAVNRFTGQDEYQFGDLTKALDTRAKDAVAAASGKDQYEVGDLSRLVDGKCKEALCRLTGKDSYEFGDVTRTIYRRVAAADFTIDELFFLIRGLLAFGVGLSPVAGFLPVKVMVDLMNYALIAEAGDRVAKAIATEIEKKARKALTGDQEYTLGDLSKQRLVDFLGKDSYQLGDVTRAVQRRLNDSQEVTASDGPLLQLTPSGQVEDSLPGGKNAESKGRSLAVVVLIVGRWGGLAWSVGVDEADLDPFVLAELERWDRQYDKLRTSEHLQ